MRDDGGFDRVGDYTNAFLGMLYPILLMGLVVIWGSLGYAVALALCGALHLCLGRWSLHRAAREAEWDARVRQAVRRGRSRP